VKQNATRSLPRSDNKSQLSVCNVWSCILGNQGVAGMYEFITALLTAFVPLNRTHKTKIIDCNIANLTTLSCLKMESWMSVESSWLNTVIEQQKQEHYMTVPTDPLDNPLITRPIWIGFELSFEPYLNWQCVFIDKAHRVYGDGLVRGRTQTRSSGVEPLLTLFPAQILVSVSYITDVSSLPCRLLFFVQICHPIYLSHSLCHSLGTKDKHQAVRTHCHCNGPSGNRG